MNKLLSLAIAAIMLAAALAGCGTPAKQVDANIRLTSSDATDAAKWLDDRLDKIPDKIVMGTSADGYGVDVSKLEDDGYIIRNLAGEIALFARTANGLDRAVRKYAKSVEKGERLADETFHEGYRIERLTIAGNDISEYAIKVECRSEFFRRQVTDNTAYALSRLLGIACGFEPPVGEEAEHYIRLRQIDDPDFRESSYRYRVEDGDLVIEFIEEFGAKNGAVMFLQNECGWTDLISGIDVLEESDLVAIPADLDVTLHPFFEGGITQTTDSWFYYHGSSLAKVNLYLFRRGYRIPSAHHALGSRWAYEYGFEKTGHLPCMTDDEVLFDTADEMEDYIKSRLAAGEELSEAMAHIDLGMQDENKWCECKQCFSLYVNKGKTWAAPMVYFANRLEEELDARGYDGIKYSVFAYAGSNPPPTIAPNEDIYITLVTHDACDIHFYDGSQCGDGDVPSWFMQAVNRNYTGGARRILNNEDWAAWIRGWHDLGAKLYIRVATLSSYLQPFATMYSLYENMQFFRENGCMSIYNETYTAEGLDFNHIVHELYQIILFHPDITKAEYYEEYCRLLEKYYGDGWRGILKFLDVIHEAELRGTCRSSWSSDTGRYNYSYFASMWDEVLDAIDGAAMDANSARQEFMCKSAKCSAINMGCLATYFYAYNAEDEETMAKGEALWSEMLGILADAGWYDGNGKYVLPPEDNSWGYTDPHNIGDTLFDQAWYNWKNYRDILRIMGVNDKLRPRPEGVPIPED